MQVLSISVAEAGSQHSSRQASLAQGGGLTDINCTLTGFCVAVGDGGTVWTYDGITQSAPSSGTTNNLQGISCVSSSFCVAVGVSGTIVAYNGISWSPQTSGTTTTLNQVSCATTTFCIAVGASGTILAYNGTSWSPQTSGVTTDLLGVSCPSVTFCIAGGSGAISYNGSNWVQQAFPQAISALNVVSCISSNFCAGGGFYFNGDVRSTGPAVVNYDGSHWTYTRVDGAWTDHTEGVSCTTTTFCMEVAGSYSNYSIYNGIDWLDQGFAGPADSHLYRVSCSSATFCLGIGIHSNIGSWIWVYNGTSWSELLPSGPLFVSAPSAGSSFNLGAVKVGATKTNQVVVSNGGDPITTLTVSAANLTGANAGEFQVTTSLPVNVVGGSSQTLDLTCTPSVFGTRSATLNLTTNDPNHPTVGYNLSCVGGYVVKNNTNNGSGDTVDSLSYVLKNQANTAGQGVVFELNGGGNIITLTGPLSVPIASGVTIDGGCSPTGPDITLQAGNGLPVGTKGLVLGGNDYLNGLKVKGFLGQQISVGPGAGANQLSCVIAMK